MPDGTSRTTRHVDVQRSGEGGATWENAAPGVATRVATSARPRLRDDGDRHERVGSRARHDRGSRARELVWDVLAEIDGWPSWNSHVKLGVPDGTAREGNAVSLEGGAGHEHPTLQQIHPPHVIA